MNAAISLRRRAAAEALGTGLLVATVVGSGIMAAKLSGGSLGLALLCNTIPTAAILFVLITVIGPLSGAHMNPVVSAVFVARGTMPVRELPAYALAQIAGGAAGAVLAHGMFDLPLVQWATTSRTGPGQWLSEGVATFALVFVILGTLRQKPEAVPVSVALVITAAYWFTASTSFANPAVTIARSLTDTFAGIAPKDVAGFLAAQCAGASLASVAADFVLGHRQVASDSGKCGDVDAVAR